MFKLIKLINKNKRRNDLIDQLIAIQKEKEEIENFIHEKDFKSLTSIGCICISDKELYLLKSLIEDSIYGRKKHDVMMHIDNSTRMLHIIKYTSTYFDQLYEYISDYTDKKNRLDKLLQKESEIKKELNIK